MNTETLTPTKKPRPATLALLRGILAITLVLSAAGLYAFVSLLPATPVMRKVAQIALLLGGAGIAAGIVLFVLTWTSWNQRLLRWNNRLVRTLGRLKWFNLILFILGIAIYSWLLLGEYGRYFTALLVRVWLLWLLTLAGCVFLKAWSFSQPKARRASWREFLLLSVLLAAFSYRMAAFLPEISTYPFTLTWSETSRYYYASLFFAEQVYSAPAPPTVLHPSRYLMQSLPFLIPGSPLWLHRAWQVFLWWGTIIVTGYLLARRLHQTSMVLRTWAIIGWTVLFMLVGPVYYHLLVPVSIILWGFDGRWWQQTNARRILSILSLLVASAWAGISRINWFPVPAMLAAALYLMEQPVVDAPPPPEDTAGRPHFAWFDKKVIRYLLPVFAWGLVGMVTAFGAQALYILWSGNKAEEFTTSLSSDLLWYRLLPNPTFPLGLLPAILYISMPLLLIITGKLLRNRGGYPTWRADHPWRLIGLVAMLSVLFAGGLVVSVKIGGGSNLHNFDAYLALLAVIAAYFLFDRAAPDWPNGTARTKGVERGEVARKSEPTHRSARTGGSLPRQSPNTPRLQWPMFLVNSGVVLTIIVTVLFILPGGQPYELPGPERVSSEMSALEKFIDRSRREAAASGAPDNVLFISNRHLLTFKQLPGIPLVTDYERVFLMEMAMAGSPDYLGRFRQDLKERRFAIIVTEPLFNQIKDPYSAFGAENNAWVEEISNYILCYYKPVRTLKETRIQLLTPKTETITECPEAIP